MRKLARRGLVLGLFAALVVVLLWFQGLILRPEPVLAEVPEPPRVAQNARRVRVAKRALASVQVHPGFVEAVDPAELAPRVMGSVLELSAREGDRVAAGEVLARLDDRDATARLAQAEAALAAAEARAEQAALAFERVERLRAADAATTAEGEAALAARDGARAEATRAREGVDEARAALSWYRLVAPFDGTVLERRADPGQLAQPGRPVLVVYRAERLRLAVAVPEERVAGLALGAELRVAFDGLPERAAELVRILPAADESTGTVTLHLVPREVADLRPGLLGRLLLEVGRREALLVPEAAVERVGQIERVRLVRDGRVVPATVRTGKRHGDEVEVLAGLAEGEEVLLP